MKKDGEVEFTFAELKARSKPRPGKSIEIGMPLEAWQSLEQVAARRDMSVAALMRLYIGHGLRRDLAKDFTDNVLERTAQVLSSRLAAAEVSEILREIRLNPAA